METRVRDRRTGRVFAEPVFGAEALERLYGTSRHGRLLRRAVRTHAFNRGYGWLKRRPTSRRQITGFVASLRIDASEAERPIEAYESLDAFFTRRLRSGARPIDPDPGRLVSPCDARAIGFASCPGELRVKRSHVTLAALLGDGVLARRFTAGPAVVLRLAPADYHRFHFPADGTASAPYCLPGPLESVHPIALAAGAPSFENQREVTLLETAGFGCLALVEVGALVAGRIEQTYRPGRVWRGDEKGMFHFGGSTVVLLAEPGHLSLDDDLLADTAAGLEVLVRMGTGIARAGVRAAGLT
jgi:phosphatidylserine decarboxylase